MKQDTHHMVLHHNTWNVRIQVPEDVRDYFDGQGALIKTTRMKESQVKEAQLVRDQLLADWYLTLNRLRTFIDIAPEFIENLGPQEEISLPLTGLRARGNKDSSASWLICKKMKGVKSPIRRKLGTWPDMSLNEAEDKCRTYRKLIDEGIYPEDYEARQEELKNEDKFLLLRNGYYHFAKRISGTKKEYRVSLKTKDVKKARKLRDKLLKDNEERDEDNAYLDSNIDETPATTPNPRRIGDITEHKAEVWLLEQGYEVFRNISATGPADLVIFDSKTGEHVKIDVKSSEYSTQKIRQKELNIKLLVHDKENNTFKFKGTA
tara:strand:- start:32 stop:991 length:960 start_codon:yes stop_codon:yes gene_type:complete